MIKYYRVKPAQAPPYAITARFGYRQVLFAVSDYKMRVSRKC